MVLRSARLVIDVRLEVLRRGSLWIPKVEDLIKELVDEDKVFTDRLLGENLFSLDGVNCSMNP